MIKRSSINELLEKHQVRKTKEQKQYFYLWLQDHSKKHGYSMTEQSYKQGKGKNLLVGDVKKAEVILTAHYDTAASSILPVTTIVGSVPMYLLSQLGIILPIVVIGLGLYFLLTTLLGEIGLWGVSVPMLLGTSLELPLITLIFMILWGWQMMFGFANQKNANDNTSGVAVLISLLEDMPLELRDKVCFVFFDEEEKGLVGSKVFHGKYSSIVHSKPLINFDCVGHGKHLLFITKKQFRASRFNDLLSQALEGKALMKPANRYIYPSDQILFKCGVGVAAVHRTPVIGYCLKGLHSRWDTKFNEQNIETLKEATMAFIKKV